MIAIAAPPPEATAPAMGEADLDFVVGSLAPDAADPDALKRLLARDEQFRDAMLGDDALLERVLNADETFIRISPALYFEILLRRSRRDLRSVGYTEERDGRASIPVFDAPRALEFIERPGVLEYLASMMASFTRVRSYSVPVRVRRGVRRRVRYDDMDVDSLVRFAAAAEPRQRFGYYKRIADVCLFVSGVFPDGAARLGRSRRARRSLEDYESEGRRFYALAAAHPAARAANLAGVFAELEKDFAYARKSLAFLSARFLRARKRQLFGAEGE